LAIVCDNLGREELAERVLGNAHRSPLAETSPDVAHRISEILWKAGDSKSAEALWNRVAYEKDGSLRPETDDGREVCFAVVGALFHLGPLLPPDTVTSFLSALSRYAELKKQAGYSSTATAAYAGIAEGNFHTGRFGCAFRAMTEARRLDSDIERDHQFCATLAATLFELGRYQLAERLYLSMFEEDGLAMTLCRLGDAQMFAGKYHESVETFSDAYDLAVREQQPFESIWTLRRVIAETAHNMVGSQRRNPGDATVALKADDVDGALLLDALCADAWSRRGTQVFEEGDEGSALVAHAMAAGLDSKRLADAVKAIGLGLSVGLEEFPFIEMITLTVIDLSIATLGVDELVEAMEDYLDESAVDPAEHRHLLNELHKTLSLAAGEGSTSTWIDGGRLFVTPFEKDSDM
jgi:tetratricopeptide (TPR) repeat protein